jgi:Flp pilus assembly protein TadG
MALSADTAGSVLVEAALVLPIIAFAIIGSFDLYQGMIARQQLVFTTQEAALVEARNAGTGVAWAQAQMPAAQFTATAANCGAQLAGSETVPTVLLPSFTVNATACAPPATS